MNREKKSSGVNFIKYGLPPLLLAGVILAMFLIVFVFKKDAEVKELEVFLPRVEVETVKSQSVELSVKTQGTVKARIDTLMLPEVSGLVEKVAPVFYPGGFFKKGDMLLQIDDTEYRASLANANGMIALAKLGYEQELALSKQAEEDWKAMGLGKGKPSSLVLRIPQLEKAQADLDSAKSMLELAERNLRYTSVSAPYDGRVSDKFVDVGQTVSARQTQLGRIYSVDYAEIRLPISVNEAGFLDLPRNGFSESKENMPNVVLSARYGGKNYEWPGVIDRVEGKIDPRTRQVYLVAKVDDPYGLKSEQPGVPLIVGLFVEANISGKKIENGFIVSRAALQHGNRMYVINDESRLEIRNVTVLQYGIKSVIISDGLKDFDRVCLTPLEFAVEGMKVEVEQ